MAQVDSPEFIDSALQLYHREVRRSIKAQEERLQQLQTAQDQLQQTIATVQVLPTKLRHQVMVPFGRQAFFPGQLTHTNEFLVHLGDQYYVETTAAAAQGILQRKLAVVTEGVQNAEKQLQSLRARLDLTQSTLREGTSADNAVEIRSTLEESDDLLTAAGISRRPHKQSSAAAAIKRQQQQQPVSRVTAAAGYSYTPLGLPQPSIYGAPQPQQQQQELDHDDVALQARLEELIRLEEQQEIAELEERQQQQQPQVFLQQQQLQQQQQQQQQQWHQEALDSIAEGDEEQDEASAAAAAGSSRLGAAERLQQLEAEADSDDEEQQDHEKQQLPREQTQQQKEQPLAASLQAVVQHQTASSRQSLERQLQQKPQASAPQSAASGGQVPTSPAVAGRKPLKSALKKGFLAPSVPIAQQLNSARKINAVHAAGTSQNRPNSTSSQAFTGAVVERPLLGEPVAADVVMPAHAAPVPAVGAVLEQPVAAASGAGSWAADNGSVGPRVSKFKLRRMGLEPRE